MPVTCPLPALSTDIITLGHGSGGLLTHRLLETGVFDILRNDWLDQQHDGASLELNGRVAFSTDSYVIDPLFFPGGDIGELAVNGTVNDLAMCGAAARYLSLSFIIEEGLPVADLRRIISSIHKAAGLAQVHIVTGDTKVVERGKGDKIFINTSGIGSIHPQAAIHHNRIAAGDVLILSGNIAAHGTAIMSIRKGLEFETSIRSDTAPLGAMVIRLLDRWGSRLKFLRDPTRGGLASVLNEIAGLTRLGFQIAEERIPVEEEVEAACEMLGLDPLYVANEGLFLAVVQQEAAEGFLESLRGEEQGRHAAIIGEVTSEYGGKVILKSRIGGRRVVGFLIGEQLPRIC